MKSIVLAALALGIATPAVAQNAPLIVGEQSRSDVLPEGTEVVMRTLSELSSKTAKVGDRFNLEVTEPVRVGGQVVIPVGASAVGEVTKVTKKGMFGKSGKLETRLLYVRLGTQQLRLRGTIGDRGKGGTAATVGALAVVPVAAFFVTGTSATIAPGATAVGHTEEDVQLAFSQPVAPVQIIVPTQSTVAQPVLAGGTQSN